jgi:hypothetical protein
VRRNDKVAAQRRRWTFYETIKVRNFMICRVCCQGKKPAKRIRKIALPLWENPGFTAESAEHAEKSLGAKKKGDGKSSLAPVKVSLPET